MKTFIDIVPKTEKANAETWYKNLPENSAVIAVNSDRKIVCDFKISKDLFDSYGTFIVNLSKNSIPDLKQTVCTQEAQFSAYLIKYLGFTPEQTKEYNQKITNVCDRLSYAYFKEKTDADSLNKLAISFRSYIVFLVQQHQVKELPELFCYVSKNLIN